MRQSPGLVVTAAFVGPGTVTTALVAGASFGGALLWAVAASVAITVVLQEGAARLAAASGRTLGEALRDLLTGPVRRGLLFLVLFAVVGGAAAFEAGNLLGVALALDVAFGAPPLFSVLVAADVAFLLLWFGGGGRTERVLGSLVAVMAFAFVANLAFLPVDWAALARGLVPSIPTGSELAIVALVGTTVVPYNLFLHGSLVRERGWGPDDVGAARRDLAIAVAAGGILTAALVATAATLPDAPRDAPSMARALEPALGPAGRALFAAGLAAAAFTSAVTAPLAGAYAATHLLGLADRRDGVAFRAVWIGVLVVGLAAASIGAAPVGAILVAQAANGVLLPLVASSLVLALNRRGLGRFANGRAANLAGALAVGATGLLAARLLWAVA